MAERLCSVSMTEVEVVVFMNSRMSRCLLFIPLGSKRSFWMQCRDITSHMYDEHCVASLMKTGRPFAESSMMLLALNLLPCYQLCSIILNFFFTYIDFWQDEYVSHLSSTDSRLNRDMTTLALCKQKCERINNTPSIWTRGSNYNYGQEFFIEILYTYSIFLLQLLFSFY